MFLLLNQCHLHITLTIYLNFLSLVIVYKIYPYYLLGSALSLLSVYCCTYSLLSLIVLYLSHFIFGHMLHLHMYLIFNDLFSHFPYLFFYLFLLTFGLLFNSFFSVASIPQRGIVKSRMNLIRIFKSREIDRYAFIGTRPKQILKITKYYLQSQIRPKYISSLVMQISHVLTDVCELLLFVLKVNKHFRLFS